MPNSVLSTKNTRVKKDRHSWMRHVGTPGYRKCLASCHDGLGTGHMVCSICENLSSCIFPYAWFLESLFQYKVFKEDLHRH